MDPNTRRVFCFPTVVWAWFPRFEHHGATKDYPGFVVFHWFCFAWRWFAEDAWEKL